MQSSSADEVEAQRRPVGIGANLEEDRRARRLARENTCPDAQAHQGSRPGGDRGVEVDGHSDLVTRRHHLHRRVLQEGREADLRKGAALKDPAHLFNSSLEGNVRRAIDIHEGEEIDEPAFKTLVRQAVTLNLSGRAKPAKKAKK